MLRNVRSPDFNNYWTESYKSIRKFYPDIDIKIIDNNSTCASTIPLTNCEIIQAEYPESRLFSPYYEFLKMNGYSKAVIIHDGFIFNSYIDFNTVHNAKFMWHFETHDYDNHDLETRQISLFDNNEPLLKMYNSKQWHGCLGCLLVIDKPFITMLEDKYKISRLVTMIHNQEGAIAFERVIAVLCYYEHPDIVNDLSFEGDIRNMIWGYRYSDYVQNPTVQQTKPFFKLFAGRK